MILHCVEYRVNPIALHRPFLVANTSQDASQLGAPAVEILEGSSDTRHAPNSAGSSERSYNCGNYFWIPGALDLILQAVNIQPSSHMGRIWSWPQQK